MKRIKRLGFFAVMALALSAMVGVASASAANFVAEEYPAYLEGEQAAQGGDPLTFHFAYNSSDGSNDSYVECDEVEFSGSLDEPSPTLSMRPSYSDCEAHTPIGTLPAEVYEYFCSYVFDATTGAVDVDCPVAFLPKKMIIKIGGGSGLCQVEIIEQDGLIDVWAEKYAVGGKDAMLIHWDGLDGVTYNRVPTSIFCPWNSFGGDQKTTGEFSGESSIIGHADSPTGPYQSLDVDVG